MATPDQVPLRIRQMVQAVLDGDTIADVAARYALTPRTVRRWVTYCLGPRTVRLPDCWRCASWTACHASVQAGGPFLRVACNRCAAAHEYEADVNERCTMSNLTGQVRLKQVHD